MKEKVFVLLFFTLIIFAGCERKSLHQPNTHVNETNQTFIEAELPPQKEEPKSTTEKLSLDDEMLLVEPITEIEMVFVEGGSMVIQGQEITLDSFYMNKYALNYAIYGPVHNWAIKEGYSNEAQYRLSRGGIHNVLERLEGALRVCNYLSIRDGLMPVYLREDNREPILHPMEIIEDPSSPTGPIFKYHPFYIDWDADGYRLPTEAEWEYAARGGNKSQGYIYSGSDILDEVLSPPYSFSYSDRSYIIGQKKPNELGIYDMSSLSSEWCIGPWTEPGKMEPLNNPGRIERFDFIEPFYLIQKAGYDYDGQYSYRPEHRLRTHPDLTRVAFDANREILEASLRLVRNKM